MPELPHQFQLKSVNGMAVKICNLGGIIMSITVPDRDGLCEDVVLGFDDVGSYRQNQPYFGAIIGRYGNRIANARFSLDGVDYQLEANSGHHHLHGGRVGFDKVLWKPEFRPKAAERGTDILKLQYLSQCGEEGYPGRLSVTVTYTLASDNSLRIDYEANTDHATVVNLTSHSYFNLSSKFQSSNILSHYLRIHADKFTVVDSTMIPTGEMRLVEGTPLDFRQMQLIGSRIDQDFDQLKFASGYDHNYIINGYDKSLRLAADIYEPVSGRTLEVWTTEPGVQFYSGNFLGNQLIGKQGRKYSRHAGFCIEAQHFPDSPNRPEFPTTRLDVGETYTQSTIYKFGTAQNK